MLNCNEDLGYTKAGNRKHPTRENCLDWVEKVWNNFDEDIIRTTVPNVFMSTDPCPEVEG